MNEAFDSSHDHSLKKSTMLIQLLKGGIGNQFFQIAFATALAKASKSNLAFDLRFFNHDGYNRKSILDKIFPDAKIIDTTHLPPESSAVLSEQVFFEFLGTNDMPRHYEFPGGISHIVLDGYWQDRRFVDTVNLASFRTTLEHHAKTVAPNWVTIINTSSQSLAIHVRRHDYKHHGLCSEAYYIEAIHWLMAKYGTMDVFVYSDEPNYTSYFLNQSGIRHVLVNSGDDLADLFLMSLCSYQVISNSTFSWWGAMLSTAKRVIYPTPWSFMHTPSPWLCPSDWLGVNGAVEKHAVSRQDFGKTLDLEKFRVDKETSLELVFTISPTR